MQWAGCGPVRCSCTGAGVRAGLSAREDGRRESSDAFRHHAAFFVLLLPDGGGRPGAALTNSTIIPQRLKPHAFGHFLARLKSLRKKGAIFPTNGPGRYGRVSTESNPLDDSMAGAFATCCGVNLAVQRRMFWSLRRLELRDWSFRVGVSGWEFKRVADRVPGKNRLAGAEAGFIFQRLRHG